MGLVEDVSYFLVLSAQLVVSRVGLSARVSCFLFIRADVSGGLGGGGEGRCATSECGYVF